jgi:putative oxidoreductase
MATLRDTFDRLDQKLVRVMRTYGITLLRLALAITFIWFGALKVLQVSPVADLVAQTVYWVPAAFFVPFLGVWEIAVGLGLLFRIALRLTLLFFFLQMAGTFLVLIMHPDLSFQGGNPLLLTTLGEFVVKNLVLLTAGVVIGSTVQRGERAAQSTNVPAEAR